MAVNHWWLGTTDAEPLTAANWSTAGSGGAPGVSVPGTGDEVQFDGNGNNPCTFSSSFTLGGLITLAGYTAKLDLATFDLTMDDGADITLDQGGEFDMGTGIISLTNGDFDFEHVGTLIGGLSLLSMAGTGTLLGQNGVGLFDVTIEAGATITATAPSGFEVVATGTTQVDGELVVSVNDDYVVEVAELRLGSSGVISGAGALNVQGATSGKGITVYPVGASITVANLWLRYWETGAILTAGTYAPTTKILFYADSAADSAVFDALDGTYIFDTPLVSIQANVGGAATLDFDLSANSPTILCTGNLEFVSADPPATPSVLTITLGDVPIEVQGNIVLDATGTINWTLGSGAVFNMTGTGNVFIDTDAQAIGSITINKPTSGDVEFTLVDLTIDSIDMAGTLTATSGDVDTATSATLAIGGDLILDGNAFDMGDATVWTVGGSVDIEDVTTFSKGTGSLVITGNSTITTGVHSLRAITVTGGTFTQADLLTCDGLTILSGATWDCGRFDLTVGDLNVNEGAAVTGANLDGATFNVSGDAVLRGSAGTLLDTTGSTANWTINATGQLTAWFVDLDHCVAGGTGGIAYNSTDRGTNTGWTFKTVETIDTIEKRVSMLNFASGGGILLPYAPSVAEVSLEDQLTFLDLFSGPPAAETTTFLDGTEWTRDTSDESGQWLRDTGDSDEPWIRDTSPTQEEYVRV